MKRTDQNNLRVTSHWKEGSMGQSRGGPPPNLCIPGREISRCISIIATSCARCFSASRAWCSSFIRSCSSSSCFIWTAASCSSLAFLTRRSTRASLWIWIAWSRAFRFSAAASAIESCIPFRLLLEGVRLVGLDVGVCGGATKTAGFLCFISTRSVSWSVGPRSSCTSSSWGPPPASKAWEKSGVEEEFRLGCDVSASSESESDDDDSSSSSSIGGTDTRCCEYIAQHKHIKMSSDKYDTHLFTREDGEVHRGLAVGDSLACHSRVADHEVCNALVPRKCSHDLF